MQIWKQCNIYFKIKKINIRSNLNKKKLILNKNIIIILFNSKW